METILSKEKISELLSDAHYTFNQILNDKPTIRSCFNLECTPSFRRAFEMIQFPEIYEEVMKLRRKGLVELLFDDEIFHITFDISLLEGCKLPIELKTVEEMKPKPKMNISKTLELSTANLSEDDCSALSENPLYKTFVKGNDEYGVLIVVSDYHIENLKKLNFPTLIPIMEFAKENNISYLNFDRDNEPYERFKVYNW